MPSSGKREKIVSVGWGWVLFEEIYRTKSNFSIETHFVWVSSLFHKYPFGDSWRWINCRRSQKRTKINRSKMKTRVLNLKLNSQHPFSQHCIHKHNLSQLTRLLSKFFYLIKILKRHLSRLINGDTSWIICKRRQKCTRHTVTELYRKTNRRSSFKSKLKWSMNLKSETFNKLSTSILGNRLSPLGRVSEFIEIRNISKKSEIKSEVKSDLINFLCEVQQKLATPGGMPSLVHLSYQLDQ